MGRGSLRYYLNSRYVTHYTMQHIEGYDLLCFKEKIYIPQSLRQRVLSWYHEYLLEQTIRNTMTWPGLTQEVERFCSTCPVCQLTKKERMKYGLLPPKTAESDPWVMVCVDLVGPFTIRHHSDTLSACSHYD